MINDWPHQSWQHFLILYYRYLVIKGAVCKITAITSQGGVSLTQKIGESEFPITIKFTGEYSSGVQVRN